MHITFSTVQLTRVLSLVIKIYLLEVKKFFFTKYYDKYFVNEKCKLRYISV